LPKARFVALAECGTHAFLAAEVEAYRVGEKTLANRLYPRLRPGELLTADRGFYSWEAWWLAAETGTDLLWRAPSQLGLPIVAILPDGTYLSVLINPTIRGARRAQILVAACDGEVLDPDDAHLVRVVEYSRRPTPPHPRPAAEARWIFWRQIHRARAQIGNYHRRGERPPTPPARGPKVEPSIKIR
jgi:hypothetical protein